MKHLLKLMDLSGDEILQILDLAAELKGLQKKGIEHSRLKGKTLAMIFQKASTRTRVSFETGMYQLGGHALHLNSNDLQMGRGEPIEDTARVLSRYCDGIMIRTFEQSIVEDLAKFSTIPVINGLTDFAHPCQILADLLTIREHKGQLNGLKLTWIGDGNNVCNSIIVGALKCGLTVSIACPENFEPDISALSFAKEFGKSFELLRNPVDAARDADVLVTDVWSSMGQEGDAVTRSNSFKGFQINSEIMSASKSNALVQHCLPAHRGEEITADVFEAHSTEIFDEAENRLHVQKAVMCMLMER